MDKREELILRASKEIVIKFIETGRVSLNSFPEIFRLIYETIQDTIKKK